MTVNDLRHPTFASFMHGHLSGSKNNVVLRLAPANNAFFYHAAPHCTPASHKTFHNIDLA
jgi:hypothetical protein